MHFELASQAGAFVIAYLVPLGWKLLGALSVWVIGGWAIRLLRGALHRFLTARRFDPTLAYYLDAGANVVLKLLVVIVILGVLGIETTSFAALIAAAGIAIGAAWSGLLSNFAAGLFLLTFRPFKVGDAIAGAGVSGTVREIGLFTTTIDTENHVQTYVGNNKLFADNVQNFSANPCRRVDILAQIPGGIDVEVAADTLRERIGHIPNVLLTPPAAVEILKFSPAGATLTAQPYCRNEHYWQVYFDTNRAISRMFAPARVS
jgi:small conductance mechanosensitive channel